MCPGQGPQATNVGLDCWRNLWAAAGCLESGLPEFSEWHQTQTLEILVADVQQWATLPFGNERSHWGWFWCPFYLAPWHDEAKRSQSLHRDLLRDVEDV